MRLVFFPLSSKADIENAIFRVAQELGIYDGQMPAERLFYLSDRVISVWEKKVSASAENKIYIGG